MHITRIVYAATRYNFNQEVKSRGKITEKKKKRMHNARSLTNALGTCKRTGFKYEKKKKMIMNFTLILTRTSSEWRIVTKRDVNQNTGTDHSIITHKLIGMCKVHWHLHRSAERRTRRKCVNDFIRSRALWARHCSAVPFPFTTYVVQVAVQISSAFASMILSCDRTRTLYITIFEFKKKNQFSLDVWFFFSVALQALHAQSSSHTFCLPLIIWHTFTIGVKLVSQLKLCEEKAKIPAHLVLLPPPINMRFVYLSCVWFSVIFYLPIFFASCLLRPAKIYSSDMNINTTKKNQTNCMNLIHVFVFTWFVCN